MADTPEQIAQKLVDAIEGRIKNQGRSGYDPTVGIPKAYQGFLTPSSQELKDAEQGLKNAMAPGGIFNFFQSSYIAQAKQALLNVLTKEVKPIQKQQAELERQEKTQDMQAQQNTTGQARTAKREAQTQAFNERQAALKAQQDAELQQFRAAGKAQANQRRAEDQKRKAEAQAMARADAESKQVEKASKKAAPKAKQTGKMPPAAKPKTVPKQAAAVARIANKTPKPGILSRLVRATQAADKQRNEKDNKNIAEQKRRTLDEASRKQAAEQGQKQNPRKFFEAMANMWEKRAEKNQAEAMENLIGAGKQKIEFEKAKIAQKAAVKKAATTKNEAIQKALESFRMTQETQSKQKIASIQQEQKNREKLSEERSKAFQDLIAKRQGDEIATEVNARKKELQELQYVIENFSSSKAKTKQLQDKKHEIELALDDKSIDLQKRRALTAEIRKITNELSDNQEKESKLRNTIESGAIDLKLDELLRKEGIGTKLHEAITDKIGKIQEEVSAEIKHAWKTQPEILQKHLGDAAKINDIALKDALQIEAKTEANFKKAEQDLNKAKQTAEQDQENLKSKQGELAEKQTELETRLSTLYPDYKKRLDNEISIKKGVLEIDPTKGEIDSLSTNVEKQLFDQKFNSQSQERQKAALNLSEAKQQERSATDNLKSLKARVDLEEQALKNIREDFNKKVQNIQALRETARTEIDQTLADQKTKIIDAQKKNTAFESAKETVFKVNQELSEAQNIKRGVIPDTNYFQDHGNKI